MCFQRGVEAIHTFNLILKFIINLSVVYQSGPLKYLHLFCEEYEKKCFSQLKIQTITSICPLWYILTLNVLHSKNCSTHI